VVNFPDEKKGISGKRGRTRDILCKLTNCQMGEVHSANTAQVRGREEKKKSLLHCVKREGPGEQTLFRVYGLLQKNQGNKTTQKGKKGERRERHVRRGRKRGKGEEN